MNMPSDDLVERNCPKTRSAYEQKNRAD